MLVLIFCQIYYIYIHGDAQAALHSWFQKILSSLDSVCRGAQKPVVQTFCLGGAAN